MLYKTIFNVSSLTRCLSLRSPFLSGTADSTDTSICKHMHFCSWNGATVDGKVSKSTDITGMQSPFNLPPEPPQLSKIKVWIQINAGCCCCGDPWPMLRQQRRGEKQLNRPVQYLICTQQAERKARAKERWELMQDSNH